MAYTTPEVEEIEKVVEENVLRAWREEITVTTATSRIMQYITTKHQEDLDKAVKAERERIREIVEFERVHFWERQN